MTLFPSISVRRVSGQLKLHSKQETQDGYRWARPAPFVSGNVVGVALVKNDANARKLRPKMGWKHQSRHRMELVKKGK